MLPEALCQSVCSKPGEFPAGLSSQHVQSECVQLLQLSCAEQVYVAIAASKCMQQHMQSECAQLLQPDALKESMQARKLRMQLGWEGTMTMGVCAFVANIIKETWA